MTSVLKGLPEQTHQITISRLRLPARAQNALSRAHIYTVGELLKALEVELAGVIGIGQASHNAIINSLATFAEAVDPSGHVDWPTYWSALNLEPDEDLTTSPPTVVIKLPNNVEHLSIGHLHLQFEPTMRLFDQKF
jgi:hypothetical protein